MTWEETMLKKYKTKEGVSEEMAKRRALAKSPGFAGLTPEKHKQASSTGGKRTLKDTGRKSWKKDAK